MAHSNFDARLGSQIQVSPKQTMNFDAREKPANFPTGYVPQGSFAPDQFPQELYGTEVFEVNEDLRQFAIQMAKTGKLFDDAQSRQYRVNYASNPAFAAGAAPPSVVACDTATSDVFWTGNLLGEAFENTTKLFTNGTATYCTTQQEDNGTLEALMRGALSGGLVDFSRIIIMRTASDFDRPFPGQSAATNLFLMSPGFDISIQNIPAAGVPIVIFGSLGGKHDFGPGSLFGGKPAVLPKRSLRRRMCRGAIRIRRIVATPLSPRIISNFAHLGTDVKRTRKL
ncbi:purine nucleoside permease-domain-containing protein [Cubamyces lactineus]|nr:purine nucleoside permease-domain-containing protein [Cubamyces lactineus]